MSDKKKQGRGIVQRRKAVCTSISQFLLSSFSTSQRNQFTWNISKLCQKLPLNAYFPNKFRLVCKSLTSKHSNFVTRLFNKTEMFNNCVLDLAFQLCLFIDHSLLSNKKLVHQSRYKQ